MSPFVGNFSLYDEISSPGPQLRVVEEKREQRGGETERWVGNDPVALVREAGPEKVVVNDAHGFSQTMVSNRRSKASRPDRVRLEGDNAGSRPSEGNGEGTGSGSRLEDEFARLDGGGVNQPRDYSGISKEVLPE